MRIGEVIGSMTLSKAHPSLLGGALKIVVPFNLHALYGETSGRDEPIVMWDVYGANAGTKVAISEGPEASNPFHPEQKPIDAYNAAILDNLELIPKK